jgi:type VI secretion system protein ImpH
MAGTDGRSTRDLIAEISKDGPRFRFFQAVRLLALSVRKDGRSPAIPRALRFGTPISLSFPASEILTTQKRPARHDEQQGGDHEAEADQLALLLTVGFMGLTGPSGVLPTSYTELLIERRNFYRDTSAHRFFDLFSHRALSLFYQAWRKHRFYLAHEAGERDGFTRNLLDLVGVGLTHLQSRLRNGNGGIPDMFLSHFSGLLSQKPVSAVNLAALLRGYFGVDVKVEQFVGQWISVPDAEQTCLGMHACTLGDNAFAGERIWDRQTKICIRLGPLTDTEFADFLPGQPGAIALTELVQFCVGQSLACDVRLSLDKRCVPAPRLGSDRAAAPHLGYDVWMHTRAPYLHPDDACFSLLS